MLNRGQKPITMAKNIFLKTIYDFLNRIKIPRIYEKKSENTFASTECPYCKSDDAYFYKLKFDEAGYCPDCNVNWIEIGNGSVWKLPSCDQDRQGLL